MLIETMDELSIATRVKALRELLAIAERGIDGELNAINDGWGIREHTGYAQALRDAISIVEIGE